MENQNNIIAPVRIITEKAKWDKLRIASLIFLVGFVVFSSTYFGYWYATDWKDTKTSETFNILPQQIVNGTCPIDKDGKPLCPFNILNNNFKTERFKYSSILVKQ